MATAKQGTKDECIECGYLTDNECPYCSEPICEDCEEMHYEYSHEDEHL